MRPFSLASLGLTLALVLACGGLGGTKSEPAPTEQTTTVSKPVSVSFGKPAGWEQTREEAEEDGHKLVHYTIEGPDAMVQLLLRPAGVTPPTPEEEIDMVKVGVVEELGELASFGELKPVTRTLNGAEHSGYELPLLITIDGETSTGLHRSWTVTGEKMSAQVLVDIPDASVEGVDAQIDEVLDRLVVP